MANILIVDDELGIRELLSEILSDEGYSVDLSENAKEAEFKIKNNNFDLVLLDIWMPEIDGLTLLKNWYKNSLLNFPVVIMSGHATIDLAVEAMKIGALDFLEKPLTINKLLTTIKNILNGEQKTFNTIIEESNLNRIELLKTKEGLFNNSNFNIPQNFNLNLSYRDAKLEFEKAYFSYHLTNFRESISKIAEKTGIERTHLYRKIKQLGVIPKKKELKF